MTSSHHGPYDQGYTRATMAHTKRSDLARASGPHKVRRSPDWSLQLDSPWEWVAKEVGSLTFGRALTTL